MRFNFLKEGIRCLAEKSSVSYNGSNGGSELLSGVHCQSLNCSRTREY